MSTAISGDHLQCYWKDSKVATGKGVIAFWENFGYLSESWGNPPSNEEKYLRQRAIHTSKVIQCGETQRLVIC